MIDNEDSTINGLKYQTTKYLVQGLYASDDYTDRRIDFLDVRLERIIVSSKSERGQLLLEGAINKTIEQIKQWDSLFIGEGTQPVFTQIPIFDENTSTEQKIIKLDPILTNARRNAYSRLEKFIDEINTHELKKKQHQSNLNSHQNRFKFFQIIGLLTAILVIGIKSCEKLKKVSG
jgi:hypothetical protein